MIAESIFLLILWEVHADMQLFFIKIIPYPLHILSSLSKKKRCLSQHHVISVINVVPVCKGAGYLLEYGNQAGIVLLKKTEYLFPGSHQQPRASQEVGFLRPSLRKRHS